MVPNMSGSACSGASLCWFTLHHHDLRYAHLTLTLYTTLSLFCFSVSAIVNPTNSSFV